VAWAELVSNTELDRFVLITSNERGLALAMGEDLLTAMKWSEGTRFHINVDLEAKPPQVKLAQKEDGGWQIEKVSGGGLQVKVRQLACKGKYQKRKCSAIGDGSDFKISLPEDFAIKDPSMVRKTK
jgi:hypothetical protein